MQNGGFRRKLRSLVAFLAIWSISLLILFLGLPLIIYQALRSRIK